MKKESYMLVLGASVVDIFGFTYSNYTSHNSNPGSVKVSFGGVSRNIAENMARVGVNTKFISVVGDDENGRSMIEHSKVIGYDMDESLVLQNSGTPTYMAVLDEKGEMVSAIADMKSIDQLNSKFIDSKADIIKESSYLFLDADKPDLLEYILLKFRNKTRFILDPISTEKAKSIKHLLHHFYAIKPNRLEAEALIGFKIRNEHDLERAGKHFLDMGIKNVFISLDEDGIYYANSETSGVMKIANPRVVNVTGAGDSFVAGLGYGYNNKLTIEEMVKFAVAMSTITIDHEDTINPEMSLDFVEKTVQDSVWVQERYR